jgi:hypothetical protein
MDPLAPAIGDATDRPGRSKQAEKGELNWSKQQEPVEIHQERHVNQLNTRIFKTPKRKKIGT